MPRKDRRFGKRQAEARTSDAKRTADAKHARPWQAQAVPRWFPAWLAIPAALFLAALWYMGSASPYAWSDFPLDDAWIHRVYARAVAAGQGFAYNPGQQETGATSPLWAVVSAPAHWLAGAGDAAVIVAVKLLTAAIALACVLLAARIILRATGSPAAAVTAAALFALEPRLAFSALSGMETALAVLLFLIATLALLERRWQLAALFAGLAPCARPEAFLFLPVMAALLFTIARREGILRRWQLWAALLMPAAAWMAFCLAVTGHPLPVTYYLKIDPFSLGADEIGNAWLVISQHGFASTLLFPAGLVVATAWTLYQHRHVTLPLLGVLGAFAVLLALATAGTRTVDIDGYYWTRWMDPATLLLTAFSCFGLSLPFAAMADASIIPARFPKARALSVRVALSALLAAAALLGAASFLRSWEDRRFHLWSDSRAINRVNVEAARWVARNVPRHAVLGVNDAGALRYFGGHTVVDLKGLNYAAFAFEKVSQQDVIAQVDWMAVFPSWFQDSGLIDLFDERHAVGIPLEEYTVCTCPGQISTIIYEKKKL